MHDGDRGRNVQYLRRLFLSHREACLPGSWFFQKVAAATGSPADKSGLETGGCRYRAGTLPQTEFFVGLPEKTAMIRQGKRV
jgi:hypothetical protein